MTCCKKTLTSVVYLSVFTLTTYANSSDGLLWSFSAENGLSNGSLDPTKFRNELKVSSSDGPETLSYVSNEGITPYFTNMTVGSGVQQATFENETCLYIPQPTNWVENSTGDGFDFVASMHNATIPNSMLPKGDCTLFMRIKWDGRVGPQIGQQYPHNYAVGLFSNGRDWASDTGWELLLDAYGGMSNNSYLSVSVGQKSLSATEDNKNSGKIQGSYCDVYSDENKGWVDIAVTLSSRPDEGEKGRTYVGFYKCHQNSGNLSYGSGVIERPIIINKNAIGKLFGEYSKPVTNSLNIRNFRGAVKTIKMWNRALSYEEVCAVFGGMQQTWTVGIANNSADEFSDSLALPTFNPRTQRWYNFPKTLTASKPSVSISLPVKNHRIKLSRVLHIKPIIPDGDDASKKLLNISLNGNLLGQVAVKTRSGNVWFFIKDEGFAKYVKDSEDMTITLTRAGDMSGEVSFDCLELGGSFQLGIADDRSHHDFLFQNGTRKIFSTVEDESKLSAQLYPKQSLDVVFPLSQEIADRYKFEFSARFYWTNPTALPINCTLNGETCLPSSINDDPSWTYIYTFEPGELSTENRMCFSTGSRTDGGSSGWAVDYWRLKVIDTQYYGLTLFIR
jgi:hypothetical protein